MLKHATVAAWKRDHHDGTYQAEIEGWTLEVRWHPEAPGKRRGFSWTAAGPGGGSATRLAGGDEEPIEEIENAMVAAEEAARRARRAQAVDPGGA